MHGKGCNCCACRPTPDEMPLARRHDRFDSKPSGSARSTAPQIDHNELGPHCHLDSAKGETGRHGGHLGTGSDSVKEAARSIESGARAGKVDFSHLSRFNRR